MIHTGKLSYYWVVSILTVFQLRGKPSDCSHMLADVPLTLELAPYVLVK